ncbi:MAG: UDP-N-acetylmuramate--L-alanine ligase [Kineosporiaceae bacterium]|nr:UDP-N-acetylmuramate--L-alanine ligase [Aeromicrobium sp.]
MKIDIPEVISPANELGHVFFIGIGGAGLSAIARLMHESGVTVSGSDAAETKVVTSLRAEGMTCFVGHDATHLVGVDTVIASTAVREDNPEIVEALRLGLRLWPRSAGLQSILAGHRTIAVAGTHGKTTTTAMLTSALTMVGASPSFAIGAEVEGLGTNARLGKGELFIAEADESDGAFLVYTPAGAIVTNVDADHLDNYGTVEAYDNAFAEFVTHIDDFLVLCADDPGAAALADGARARGLHVILAGFDDNAGLRGTDLTINGSHTSFAVMRHRTELGRVELQVPGKHYAQDALLALGAGLASGFGFADLAKGLEQHQGARRRMEFLGDAGGVRVYDSYAHHPTEIRGDIAAARGIAGDSRLVVAFQPHLVSRTRVHGEAMGIELSAADLVVVADIYLAREDPDPAVTTRLIIDSVSGPSVIEGGPVAELDGVLVPLLQPGDLLMTLGAGDISTVGAKILTRLAAGEYVPDE